MNGLKHLPESVFWIKKAKAVVTGIFAIYQLDRSRKIY